MGNTLLLKLISQAKQEWQESTRVTLAFSLVAITVYVFPVVVLIIGAYLRALDFQIADWMIWSPICFGEFLCVMYFMFVAQKPRKVRNEN